jgi:signal transduction histidine kinase
MRVSPPSALSADRCVSLLRLRASNAIGRMLVVPAAALVLGWMCWHWAPVAWGALQLVVLELDRRYAVARLPAVSAGEPVATPAYLAWIFFQSCVANALAGLAWFLEPRHGDALAALFLAAGLFNAILTLRASRALCLAGAAGTGVFMLALPIANYALGARALVDLLPIYAAVVLFGYTMYGWRMLREGDEAIVAADAAARRAEALAREAGAARADFAQTVSQALRTPLAALAGAAEALQRASLPPEARSHVAAVAAARDVVALFDLTDIDALTHGRLGITLCHIDPRALVRNVADAHRPEAEDKGIDLFVDIHENAPADVLIDGVRVRQVLTHLISNAVKYTRHGGVRVRLQCQPGSKPGMVRLGVAVADTGVGMSRAALAAHFGDGQAPTRAATGLAAAAQLSRLMGARLAAKSTPGQGSLFTFVIEAEAPALMRAGRDGARILVVTHQAHERRQLAARLDTTGARAEIIDSSAAALEWLHTEPFELVIADQRLPDFDAIDLAQMLRQGGASAGAPLIAIAAHEDEARACLEGGASGAVIAPIAGPALLDEIARVLGEPLPPAQWAA